LSKNHYIEYDLINEVYDQFYFYAKPFF
jgi:hypothetical protein